MKKLVLLLALPLIAAGLRAQTPIVSTTDIIFNICPPLATEESATVCHESSEPFVWNGISVIPSEQTPGVHVLQRDILNEEGCTVNAKMNLTVATCHPEGAILHKFSVGPDKYVYFSQGNLQYSKTPESLDPKTGQPYPTSHVVRDVTTGVSSMMDGVYRFAPNQYEPVSDKNGDRNPDWNPQLWCDIFGYGTSGYDECYPWTKTSNGKYATGNISGTNYDWGTYNAIYNGGNEPGIWRMLTKDEWEYLFGKRTNYAALAKSGYITVGGKSYYGIFIFPDDWVQPIDIYFNPSATMTSYSLSFNASDWEIVEKAGAVFMPTSYSRNNSGEFVDNTDSYHYFRYYTGSFGSSNPFSIFASTSQPPRYDQNNKNCAYPVRLVMDVLPCDQ